LKRTPPTCRRHSQRSVPHHIFHRFVEPHHLLCAIVAAPDEADNISTTTCVHIRTVLNDLHAQVLDWMIVPQRWQAFGWRCGTFSSFRLDAC
jgi:hypothetical protein